MSGIDFRLQEQSLFNFYLELPREVKVFAELSSDQNEHSVKVSSTDNKGSGENFTKNNRQTHVSSISLHELLDKGMYNLRIEMQGH